MAEFNYKSEDGKYTLYKDGQFISANSSVSSSNSIRKLDAIPLHHH